MFHCLIYYSTFLQSFLQVALSQVEEFSYVNRMQIVLMTRPTATKVATSNPERAHSSSCRFEFGALGQSPPNIALHVVKLLIVIGCLICWKNWLLKESPILYLIQTGQSWSGWYFPPRKSCDSSFPGKLFFMSHLKRGFWEISFRQNPQNVHFHFCWMFKGSLAKPQKVNTSTPREKMGVKRLSLKGWTIVSLRNCS